MDSVNWNTATSQAPLTHIIDFGPGHASGIGGLTHRNKDGSGVQVSRPLILNIASFF